MLSHLMIEVISRSGSSLGLGGPHRRIITNGWGFKVFVAEVVVAQSNPIKRERY